MRIHELKTDPIPFDDVLTCRKTFEIRLDDRQFVLGDILHLRETSHSADRVKNGTEEFAYTGREMIVKITHTLKGYGLKRGWCVLSIKKLDESGLF